MSGGRWLYEWLECLMGPLAMNGLSQQLITKAFSVELADDLTQRAK
jgi:hypothetical protein